MHGERGVRSEVSVKDDEEHDDSHEHTASTSVFMLRCVNFVVLRFPRLPSDDVAIIGGG